MRAELDKTLSLAELASVYGGLVATPDVEFCTVTTDSRLVKKGDLFIALSGENYDGHQFCQMAVEKGAAGLVVNRYISNLNVVQWIVNDTLTALANVAQFYRQQFQLTVIAITGSSGKTTTKEILKSMLQAQFAEQFNQFAVVTENNYNNEIGVPFTLMNINRDIKIAVIEMGARQAGDIKRLCDCAKPTISLVNNVGTAHIGVFGSQQAIVDTKGEIYDVSGLLETAVLNIDSVGYEQYYNQTKPLNQVKISVNNQADIWASNIKENDKGISFTLHIFNNETDIHLNVLGVHNVANALTAVGCAWSAGVNGSSIMYGLRQFKAAEGRLSIKYFGDKGYVIDDSYNANPSSMKAAVDVLMAREGKRILVLGDMGELGANALSYHKLVFNHIESYKKNMLNDGEETIQVLFVGDAWSKVELSNQDSFIQYQWFCGKYELIETLRLLVDSTSTVLVKGSRFMQMETIIEGLIAEDYQRAITDHNSRSTSSGGSC